MYIVRLGSEVSRQTRTKFVGTIVTTLRKTTTMTMAPAFLFKLPVEIIQLLGEEYLPKKDVKTMRSTCKILDNVHAPQLFRSITIDSRFQPSLSVLNPRILRKTHQTYPRQLIHHLQHLCGSSDEILPMMSLLKERGRLQQLRSLDVRMVGLHQVQQMIRVEKTYGSRTLEQCFGKKAYLDLMKLPTIDDLWDLIAQCSSLENLKFDCVPNCLDWDATKTPKKPFWPKLQKLGLSSLPYYSRPAKTNQAPREFPNVNFNHVLRHAPNIEELHLHLSRIFFDKMFLRHLSSSLAIEAEDFVNIIGAREYAMTKDVFYEMLDMCPKLKAVFEFVLLLDNPIGYDYRAGKYIMPQEREKAFPQNRCYPQMKCIFGTISKGEEWQNFSVWKSLFPNLESFTLEANDGGWEMSNEPGFTWGGLASLFVAGKTGPTLDRFIDVFPNLVKWQVMFTEQKWSEFEPILPCNKSCFPYLKSIRLERMNGPWLEWLLSVLKSRDDEAPKIKSLYLENNVDDVATAKSLLKLLEFVAEDLKYVSLDLPKAFDPNWLFDKVWPESTSNARNISLSLSMPSFDWDVHDSVTKVLFDIRKRGESCGIKIRLRDLEL